MTKAELQEMVNTATQIAVAALNAQINPNIGPVRQDLFPGSVGPLAAQILRSALEGDSKQVFRALCPDE